MGSRSIPTVHPCSQSGGGCGLLAKALQLHEPNHEGNGRSIHNNFEKEFWKVGFLKEFFFFLKGFCARKVFPKVFFFSKVFFFLFFEIFVLFFVVEIFFKKGAFC